MAVAPAVGLRRGIAEARTSKSVYTTSFCRAGVVVVKRLCGRKKGGTMIKKVIRLSIVVLTLATSFLLFPWKVNAADFVVRNDISQSRTLQKYVHSKGSFDDIVDEYEIKVPDGKYAEVSVSGERSIEDVACASGLCVGSRQYINSDIELRCNAGTSYVTVRLSVSIFDYQSHSCRWRYWITIKYHDILPTYTVTYVPGEYGIGSQQTATKTKGVDLVLKGALFTRMGYTQTGWSKTDGGAKQYDLGASYVTDASIMLYPSWTKRVPVPDLVVDAINISPDSPITRGEECVLNFTIKNIGDEVAAQSVVQIFDREKVLGKVSIESLLVGASCTKSYVLPTLSTGEHQLMVIITAVSGEAAIDNNISERIELWVQMQGGFSVRFSANGGIGVMPDQEFETGLPTLKLSANKFYREGYVFVGWSIHENEEPCYADESIVTRKSLSISDPDPMGSSATLYAAWGKEVVPAYLEGVLARLYPGVVFYTGGMDGCWIEDSNMTLKSNGRANWIAAKVRGPGTFSYVSTETSAGDDVATFYGFVGGDVGYEGLLVENLTDYNSRYGQFYRSVTISDEVDCILGWGWYAAKNDGKYMQLSELSWTANVSDVYAVVYKPGAQGVGSCQTTKKKRGEALALAEEIFTRTGYTQTGWAMADGGGKAYNLGALYTFDSAITLYPYWTADAPSTPTYGPWGESEAVKNQDKLWPTFLTNMMVEIDGEPAMYGDVVAVFRGDTGALCGLGKVMDDSGTLTAVCYVPKGVTLSFKIWLSESGIEEAIVVRCDNASKLIAPESGSFYEGHEISGTTAEIIETIVPGEKVEIDTGFGSGYTASGLPSGLKYNRTTGIITGAATKPTAAEGTVVKFTKSGVEPEELTIIVTAIPKVTVVMEGVNSPSDTDNCKVTGAGAFLVDRTVTLKATAPKGVVFMGWYDGGSVVAAQATYTFTMGKKDIELVAKFKKEVMSVGCKGLSDKEYFPAGVTGAEGGIALDISTESGVKSIKVDKLPTGMKYDSKIGRIIGAPTKAGDNTVVITVTAVSGAVEKKEIKVAVEAMPVMAVGKFDGFVLAGKDNAGTFTLTTTDAGKLTAKVITAAGTISFSGTCWDTVKDGVYRATLTTKSGEKLALVLDSTAAWDANQLSGSFTTAAKAETAKTAAVPSRSYSLVAQRNAFSKTWYFAAEGNEAMGWTFAYAKDSKTAAFTVTMKADGTTMIAGKLPNGIDESGRDVFIKVSASGYANVGGLKEGVILADFAPVMTVNKVKKVLAIKTNLWFDCSDGEVMKYIGSAKFVE